MTLHVPSTGCTCSPLRSVLAATATLLALGAADPPESKDKGVVPPLISADAADALFDRLIDAFGRGRDADALELARRLESSRQAAQANADTGVILVAVRYTSRGRMAMYLRNQTIVPALLADLERRAREAPRTPVPPQGGDPAARVAALIRDFDQIHFEQNMFNNFHGSPAEGAIVDEVVAEGDAAVEPLLAALESDTRLTRTFRSDLWGQERLSPVSHAIYAALQRLLLTDRFLDRREARALLTADRFFDRDEAGVLLTAKGRQRVAQAARARWERVRRVPLIERWYRTLADNSASPELWLQATAGLIQPPGSGAPTLRDLPRESRSISPSTPLMGEPLRDGRDPSVTTLLERRCRTLAGTGPGQHFRGHELVFACILAREFSVWDVAGALPTLRQLMTRCRQRSLDPKDSERLFSVDARHFTRFVLIRARAGDREALDEYAEWIQAIDPMALRFTWSEILEPLWTYPEHASIAAASRALYLTPRSRWLPLIPVYHRAAHIERIADQIASPMACVPAYRQALLAALGDTEPVGTARRQHDGRVEFTLNCGETDAYTDRRVPDPADRPGIDVAVRRCDFVAWRLSTLDGAPECLLTWPEARRDKAAAACAEYLRRYGPHLVAEDPPDDPYPRAKVARLHVPALKRPATPADVRGGRAVFSAGEAEARVVTLASGLPVRARWRTLEAFPVLPETGPERTGSGFLQEGWVWQAEEFRDGDRWTRFYGFVGHGTMARVAASEIDFAPDLDRGLRLPGGLSARVETQGSATAVFAAGKPVPVTLRLYNDRGVDNAAPTEFVRMRPGARPALLRGVTLVLNAQRSVDVRSLGSERSGIGPKLEASDRIDAGNASRNLAPTESFEALRLDLNDWYGRLQPGRYVFHIEFDAASGIGPGQTNAVRFSIVEPVTTDR